MNKKKRIGIINHMGKILVMNGGRLLAFELKMNEYLQLYTFASKIFAILVRLINSKLYLKVSYEKRIYFLSLWFIYLYMQF